MSSSPLLNVSWRLLQYLWRKKLKSQRPLKRALESALNVQTAHYLGRNQTLYPCCATRTG